MPYKEIKFEQIMFDREVQNYFITPKFECPNYGHFWTCPPEAPYLEEEISNYSRFFLIYYKFDLKKYIKKVHMKNSKIKELDLKISLYRKQFIRDLLESEIKDFVENYKEPYIERLILWDGFCRICHKEGKSCTYDEDTPCRYPKKMRYSMEAVGIDVNATVENINIYLEWPPVNFIIRTGLVCYK